ncbi:dienelactone hydrolase family protein [Nocardioides sp. AE5]|uniref:dienelactone hydrolase family protein n=1 Tax=Nocardioides sp. AE5 TaxID=2962573 RepID=UPI002882A51D|nr:dienelactone hydrolase family protein [Nocardioides sp. AE5]MDT0202956.1 dienelactone hydrolase family protein [Nocardioides sp. AE5]
MADDPLLDFERSDFTADGSTRPVYRAGTGPAVIVIAEIPGITPRVADFARTVRDAGFSVAMPHLFGMPGRDPDIAAHGRLGTLGTMGRSLGKICVSREFSLFATGKTSPVVTWLRALAAHEHERCGGPGVGAVGMCLTGGFALAMATDERMLAPVLSQPSLPLAVLPGRKRGTDISDSDLAVVKQRCAAGDLQVMGLRFKSDVLVPGERFAWLREQLGDAFVAVELDDEDANPDALIAPHSVLTEHYVDAPGSRTRAALDDVLGLFRTKLLPD